MRVRAQDQNGDYTFGQSQGNFLIDSPACVAQLVETRLLLMEGEWYLNLDEGTPYSSEILGYGTQSLYDAAVQKRIIDTPGVIQIVTYSSDHDPVTRRLTIEATVLTQFSVQPAPVNVIFSPITGID